MDELCGIVGCDQTASWIDEKDDLLCDDCLEKDMDETGLTIHNYEKI